MAGIESLEQLMTKFNDFYVNKKYTDVVISVIENDPLLTRESASVEKGTVVSTINTHAIILDVNSVFFEKMLTPQKDLPTNLEIQINKGERRLIEIMVSSFYDKRILNTLGIIDLLGLLELGMTYANEEFMKYTAKVMEGIELDLEICTEVLHKLYSWEPTDKLTKFCANVRARCTTFLVNFFSPIEEKHDVLEKFLSMNYASLIYILECDEILSFSENSLLTFIISWLEYDITRQTGIIIERLLKSLRVKFLSSEFLSCTITFDHTILNKWAGFKCWIFKCIALPGMPSSAKAITKSTFDVQVSRNVQYGIHAWYQNCANIYGKHLTAVRWFVHMTPEVMGEIFGPTPHFCIHDGIKFSPQSIIITPIDGDPEKYNMNLSISCSGLLSDVRFVVGIVPADREYDVAKQYFHSAFAQQFLKWTPSITFNSNVHTFDFWTVSKDFIDLANERGLSVCLLPVTNDEYTKLSSMYFSNCYSCGAHSVVGSIQCHYCGQYTVSVADKIHLTKSTNYSL